MAYPERLLGADEHVVVSLRAHAKVLFRPVLVLLVVAAAAGFALGAMPVEGTSRQAATGAVVGAAVLAVARWSAWPFLSWLSTSYTVTTERLITRTGVLNRRGRDIPMNRINDVAYEQGLADRVFGAGTLVVSAASEQGQVVLSDVPRVHEVQLRLSELVRAADGERDGEPGRW